MASRPDQSSTEFALPEALVVAEITETHERFAAATSAHTEGEMVISAAATTRCDTAGIQWLVAVQRDLAKRGVAHRLIPSEALTAAADALDLSRHLQPSGKETP